MYDSHANYVLQPRPGLNSKFHLKWPDMPRSCSPSSAEDAVRVIPRGGASGRADDIYAVYIFMGCIVMGNKWWKYLDGALIIFAGIAYIALEFIPSIEAPANMRDADAGWGAEQV